MSAFIPTSLPFRQSLPSRTRQTPRCALDTEAPPESRYKTYFPPPCFEAPHISLLSSTVELVNKIGVVREEVALDVDFAARFLEKARATQAKTADDLSAIFSGPATDLMTADPVEKYYPSFRRDEAPIIAITPPGDDSQGEVTVGLGSVIATPPSEEEVKSPDVQLGSSWNQGPKLSASQVVDMYYGKERRNRAPVIEVAKGSLAISMEMKEILGECEAELYPKDMRFMAPKIEIRKPAGDWDSTGFLILSMEEVQLPLTEAAILKVPE